MHKELIQYLNRVYLVPAYGRQYQTEEAVLKDWNAGKDFKIDGGPYCSIRDRDTIAKEMRNPTVIITFARDKFVEV